MIQTTVKVSGMACSMCEAHVNATIRRAFSVEIRNSELPLRRLFKSYIVRAN